MVRCNKHLSYQMDRNMEFKLKKSVNIKILLILDTRVYRKIHHLHGILFLFLFYGTERCIYHLNNSYKKEEVIQYKEA